MKTLKTYIDENITLFTEKHTIASFNFLEKDEDSLCYTCEGRLIEFYKKNVIVTPIINASEFFENSMSERGFLYLISSFFYAKKVLYVPDNNSELLEVFSWVYENLSWIELLVGIEMDFGSPCDSLEGYLKGDLSKYYIDDFFDFKNGTPGG